jgi:hypothetical protein
MKKLLYHIVLLLFLSIPFRSNAQIEPVNPDEAEILSTFANFKIGLKAKLPELLSKNISRESVVFFQNIYQHALYSDSLQIMQLPVTEMIFVIQSRVRAYERLKKTDNLEAYYQLLMDIGVLVEEDGLEIILIEKNGDTAICSLAINDVPSKKEYRFVKEDGYWKVDLKTPFNIANERFRALLNDEQKMKLMNLDFAGLIQQILDKNGVPRGQSAMWQPPKSTD